MIEALDDIRDLPRAEPRRRKFDRQRETIKPGTQLGDRHTALISHREICADGRSSIDQELHRLVFAHRLERRRGLRIGKFERRHRVHVFALDVEGLAAVAKRCSRGHQRSNPCGQDSDLLDDVFAVVEKNQREALAEVVHKLLLRRAC